MLSVTGGFPIRTNHHVVSILGRMVSSVGAMEPDDHWYKSFLGINI